MNQVRSKNTVGEIIQNAQKMGLAIPAFNIPYLPMMEPVVQAVVDLDSFALIAVARIEWTKFEARGLAAVVKAFEHCNKPDHVRLHLDHVPVIDEDGFRVDYVPIIQQAIELGYESVMIDGSRLSLEENIQAVRPIVELAHEQGIPVEAELGSVFGHESGPMPAYEELFSSGKGFTDVNEAHRFVKETDCDWLSVAVGSIHGAVATGQKDIKKVEARLNIDRLEQIQHATGIPLVLHGGSGIKQENVHQAIKNGIAKINIGTEIRQAYEAAWKETKSTPKALQAAYDRTRWVIEELLGNIQIREKVFEI